MGLIKEPKEIDLSTKSEPWTEEELTDFRKLMSELKLKNSKRKTAVTQTTTKPKLRV
ncbi:hypothetical protein [Flavobacterium aurantiibacter]|uniref:hypothetical protein n=1 Tax=Flavobacterium aurantiibacter TaxID=2023067 RepID=UPI0013FD87CC|nr:hypothetical protein [Flavobacterium aurantiibacter]